MLNAKTIAPARVSRKERSMLSVLLAPYGAASFLKEGYIVYGFANASRYTVRYDGALEKRNSKLCSV